MLQNNDAWTAIDPKDIVGKVAYEASAFIRNPMPELLDQPNAKTFIQRRILKFATLLNGSETRILDWCFVQSILCWTWALDDKCSNNYYQRISNLLNEFYLVGL